MVEQTLVDMANLLDIQRAKREPLRLTAAAGYRCLQQLQRLQQMQRCAVIYRQRRGGRLVPACSRRTALQEGIAVRVEEMAAISRKLQCLVPQPAVDRAEGCQQPRPGVRLRR